MFKTFVSLFSGHASCHQVYRSKILCLINTLYLFVSYESQNKQGLFPRTAITCNTSFDNREGV
jgi:hypothetical protein